MRKKKTSVRVLQAQKPRKRIYHYTNHQEPNSPDNSYSKSFIPKKNSVTCSADVIS